MQKQSTILKYIHSLGWKWMLAGLFGILLFIFAVEIALSPLQKMKEYQQLSLADSVASWNDPGMNNYAEMKQLIKEKAYKEALLKLSESDSFQLVLNLNDSTVNLSIKGLNVQQTKVNEFRRDKLLGKMPLREDIYIFSKPLMISSGFATIVKEPVVVRHAPKDTVEAALNAWQPDTLIQEPAFVFFELEHGIHLIMEQNEDSLFYTKWKKFNFYNKLRFKLSKEALSNFAGFKKQDYHPEIEIKMPADELRAIYRALPEKAYVVININ